MSLLSDRRQRELPDGADAQRRGRWGPVRDINTRVPPGQLQKPQGRQIEDSPTRQRFDLARSHAGRNCSPPNTDVSADLWSVTSYRNCACQKPLEYERQRNPRLHPSADPKKSYLETLLAGEKGIFIAVSDYQKSNQEMIQRWVPGGLTPLGTDGFGRSENRSSLRRFFEVDAEFITITALEQLARPLAPGSNPPCPVDKGDQRLGRQSGEAGSGCDLLTRMGPVFSQAI